MDSNRWQTSGLYNQEQSITSRMNKLLISSEANKNNQSERNVRFL